MSSVLITAEEIHKTYSGGFSRIRDVVLDGCSLTINAGETVGLTGPSGCGKSTLARILAGLEKPDSGTVRYQGIEITRRGGREWQTIRRKIQILFQDPGGTFNPVRQLGASLEMVGTLPGVSFYPDDLAEVLDEVGLHTEILSRYPHEISGGQAQRLALARILLVKPELVILDEPTSALDLSVQAQILHLLKAVKVREPISYLFISHDREVLKFMSDRIMRMDNGVIIPDDQEVNKREGK